MRSLNKITNGDRGTIVAHLGKSIYNACLSYSNYSCKHKNKIFISRRSHNQYRTFLDIKVYHGCAHFVLIKFIRNSPTLICDHIWPWPDSYLKLNLVQFLSQGLCAYAIF